MRLRCPYHAIQTLADLVSEEKVTIKEARARLRAISCFDESFKYLNGAKNDLLERFGDVTMQMGDRKQYTVSVEKRPLYLHELVALLSEVAVVEIDEARREDFEMLQDIFAGISENSDRKWDAAALNSYTAAYDALEAMLTPQLESV